MSKKKKNKEPLFPDKLVVIFIFLVVICVFLGVALIKYFKASDYFRVKMIMIDSSLQYINRDDLSRYKNANIFSLDLKAIQKRLSTKYPQISDLKVVRKYPDQILLTAKKRIPFVQAKIKGQTVTFDDDGVVLSKSSDENKNFSFIQGIPGDINVSLGQICRDTGLMSALAALKSFKSIVALNSYDILNINVTDLSKIEIVLSNKLLVYIDQLGINQKLKMLSIILSQGQLNLEEVKYIDLRFKEPILGKKENAKSF